jgi:hypothetical protein
MIPQSGKNGKKMKKIINILRDFNPKTYPMSKISIDSLDDEYQDYRISKKDIERTHCGEKRVTKFDTIINVKDESVITFNRCNSYFKYFLDGTRRAYYICDVISGDGGIVPIIAGQISSAILRRNIKNGKVDVLKHIKKAILLIPRGGSGLNEGDADEIKERIEKDQYFQKFNLCVDFVKIKNKDNVPRQEKFPRLA